MNSFVWISLAMMKSRCRPTAWERHQACANEEASGAMWPPGTFQCKDQIEAPVDILNRSLDR